MAKQEEKLGRAFTLSERQAELPKLNTSPEKAGVERVKTCDLSVDFTMKGGEISKLDKGLASLWKDKVPVFENLKSPIKLGVAFRGSATIGSARGKGTTFDNARLLDFAVTPALAGELQCRARFRVYVNHETDALYDLEIAGVCKISFEGKLIKAAKSEDVDDEDDDQEKLPI